MGTRSSVDAVLKRYLTFLARNQNPATIQSLYKLHYTNLPNDQTTFASQKPLTVLSYLSSYRIPALLSSPYLITTLAKL
jgi:hypothetical protein